MSNSLLFFLNFHGNICKFSSVLFTSNFTSVLTQVLLTCCRTRMSGTVPKFRHFCSLFPGPRKRQSPKLARRRRSRRHKQFTFGPWSANIGEVRERWQIFSLAKYADSRSRETGHGESICIALRRYTVKGCPIHVMCGLGAFTQRACGVIMTGNANFVVFFER